jgi:hypothetical protein
MWSTCSESEGEHCKDRLEGTVTLYPISCVVDGSRGSSGCPLSAALACSFLFKLSDITFTV